MKIALAQMDCKLGDVAANLDKMDQLARAARATGADAIVFPEMSDTGYEMQTILRTASPADGVPRQRLAALARELQMWIIAGISLREGSSVFNTAVVFDRTGKAVAEYRKIHLFSGADVCEQEHLSAGQGVALFDFEGLSTGLMICYDLRFPELARAITLAGAEAIVVPAAWPPARIAHWSALLVARAIENQIFVIGVNRSGRDSPIEFGGRSAAIDPFGKHLCESVDAIQKTFVVNVLPDDVRTVRAGYPFLRDRRPGSYRV